MKMVANFGLTGVDGRLSRLLMAAKLAMIGCWLGKRNSDLESVLSPCLHPHYIEAVLKWLLMI
jgi:hypothetical protein